MTTMAELRHKNAKLVLFIIYVLLDESVIQLIFKFIVRNRLTSKTEICIVRKLYIVSLDENNQERNEYMFVSHLSAS